VEVLLLSRADVAALLTIDDTIAAVERAFTMLGRGELPPPAIAGVHARGGAFHIKAAIAGDRFAAKINGNFFDAVPRIKGVIVLADATDGRPLAIMDSIEITILRTGAATAVAAKYLARRDSKTALICGCGLQGRIQLRALKRVLPIEKVFALDADRTRADAFARESGAEVVDRFVDADVVVTCTPSRSAILHQVAAGTFVAAVGADSDDKQEIAPSLMASSKVVTDVTEQCATIGDLHHAIVAGAMSRGDIHAELGEVVAGRKPGRERDDETIISIPRAWRCRTSPRRRSSTTALSRPGAKLASISRDAAATAIRRGAGRRGGGKVSRASVVQSAAAQRRLHHDGVRRLGAAVGVQHAGGSGHPGDVERARSRHRRGGNLHV
jgi:ornithine cyclodeaminase/alanine dehydrogenase-like protein (mu-crystallin family)